MTDRHSRGDAAASASGRDAADPERETDRVDADQGVSAERLGRLWRLSRQPAALARRLNASRHRMLYLGAASFLESTVVPIAIELVMVPFMLANRDRIWAIATVTLAGCLIGAVLGYAIGLLFFDTVGQWLIETFGQEEAYRQFQDRFAQSGFWAIIAIGVTPVPFQIAMLVAGAADYSLALFILACALARGVRYYGLAMLVALAGPGVLDRLQKGQRATKLTAAVAVILVIAMAVFYLG